MSRIAPTLVLLTALAVAQPAHAIVTPFGQQVHQAIEDVVQYFRNQAAPDGSIGNPRALGLPVLCMLEKRQSADFFAPHVGFEGMDEDDQDLIRRAIRHIIDNDPAFTAGGNPYTYGTGNKLMALSLYKATGGEDDVQARVDVTTAVENGVNALRNNMGRQPCNNGGWNYTTPSSTGDLSTTQFAIAGLAAAVSVVEDAADELAVSPDFLSNAQNADGGHKYRSDCNGGGQASSHAMTASGLWCYRLAGVAASDERAQRGLSWLSNNYQYDRQTNWWQNSFYYYLWAAAKALAVSADDGLMPDGIFSGDVGGVRDPAEDGFPEEEANYYYDFAYLLLQEQDAQGAWPSRGRPNNSFGYDATADAAFACLVLERSLGGVCLDLDEDGLCEMEDNCPGRFNPDQQDTDFDGVGDNCDNCRLNPNIGQEDNDGDGQGDACDKHECTPTNEGLEICDGIDNDCDTHVDNIEGLGEICATGDPGVCAMGRMGCVGGEILCRPVHQGGRQEVCDLLDNDCDGLVDEDLLNACGQCGGVELDETCNGVDDDCDGFIDNRAPCEGSKACIGGACASPCDAGECADGFVCQDGYCQTLCAGVQCEAGLVCEPGTGVCIDPCADTVCGAGQICVGGACGSCLEVGCPVGTICDGISCADDPCAGVNCARGEICRQGECVDSCSQLSCPLRQTCLDGRCVQDICGGVVCREGAACVDGDCVEDPCAEGGHAACEAVGQLCEPGRECIDNPCVGVTCGDNERCEAVCHDPDPAVACGARCVGDWLPGGAPPIQDFCDPESPIYDEELCADGGEAADPDPGVDPDPQLDVCDPRHPDFDAQQCDEIEDPEVPEDGEETPDVGEEVPQEGEAEGEVVLDDPPDAGAGGNGGGSSCFNSVASTGGGQGAAAPWMIVLTMLGVGAVSRR